MASEGNYAVRATDLIDFLRKSNTAMPEGWTDLIPTFYTLEKVKDAQWMVSFAHSRKPGEPYHIELVSERSKFDYNLLDVTPEQFCKIIQLAVPEATKAVTTSPSLTEEDRRAITAMACQIMLKKHSADAFEISLDEALDLFYKAKKYLESK